VENVLVGVVALDTIVVSPPPHPCRFRRQVPFIWHLDQSPIRRGFILAWSASARSQWIRAHGRRGNGLPNYGAAARLTLRSLRQPGTRARRLPGLRAVVSSASTGCREPSVPARVPGP